MIRASAPYTSGWGSFVLLKMDCVRVARGGSLSTLHRCETVRVFSLHAKWAKLAKSSSRYRSRSIAENVTVNRA